MRVILAGQRAEDQDHNGLPRSMRLLHFSAALSYELTLKCQHHSVRLVVPVAFVLGRRVRPRKAMCGRRRPRSWQLGRRTPARRRR